MNGKITIGNQSRGDSGIYVGRPSPLGNPHFLRSELRRKEAISKYRSWLETQIQRPNSPAAREIDRLVSLVTSGKDIKLVCWCAPKACHAEVIAEVVQRKALQGRKSTMQKLSIYHELTNEALVSEHTAEAAEGREALPMSELFYEDARLWRRLADGWDVETALKVSESAWKALCKKPKLRGKGFDPEEWNRRMESYTGWRMSSILAGGEKRYQVVKLSTKEEKREIYSSISISNVRAAMQEASKAFRTGPIIAISPSGREYSWNDVFYLPIFEPGNESIYVSLVDEDEQPVHGGLLLGPIDSLNSDILDLVQSLRRRYLIDNPEMAPGLGVDLIETVSTAEGRLNSHPIWGEMYEEALGGQ